MSNYSNLLNKTPETISFTFKKKIMSFSICEFCLPLYLIKKNEKFNNLIFLENLIYKYISIEVIIPLFERISKFNFEKEIPKKEETNLYSKLISNVLNNNYLNENK